VQVDWDEVGWVGILPYMSDMLIVLSMQINQMLYPLVPLSLFSSVLQVSSDDLY